MFEMQINILLLFLYYKQNASKQRASILNILFEYFLIFLHSKPTTRVISVTAVYVAI